MNRDRVIFTNLLDLVGLALLVLAAFYLFGIAGVLIGGGIAVLVISRAIS